MTRLMLVCLAFGAASLQDPIPPPQELPEVFQGTPQGYVIQSGDSISTYQAVSAFFESLSRSAHPGRAGSPERRLSLLAARIGIPKESAAWNRLMQAEAPINAVASRRLPTELQMALRDDPEAFHQAKRAFQRQQVLDMRTEFLEFKRGFEQAGGDMQSLMAYIRAWAADHVKITADAPRDDPSVQEYLAIEALFDEGLEPKGGSQ